MSDPYWWGAITAIITVVLALGMVLNDVGDDNCDLPQSSMDP